jgi:predicted enzyme related to lactoylglutathione lyase
MPTRFRSSAAVLCVSDPRETIGYLTAKLGFELSGTVGDEPAWASLSRDAVEVMVVCGPFPDPAADWAVYVYLDDADAYYEEVKARGADLVGAPVDKPYGNREFEARLPDGRLLAFGSPIPSAPVQ